MKSHRETRLIIGGTLFLVVIGIVAVPIASALRHRGTAATLDDPNPAVRVAALRATGSQGNVDLLIQGLQDEDADVRLVAAMHLRPREDQAASAIDVLIVALRDKHAGVRREAGEALSAIGAPAAPALVTALADPDPHVRIVAIVGLSDQTKDTRKRSPEELALVMPAVKRLLEDEDPDVRRKAAHFLKYVHEK
jgi:vesicle coat complex subunit